MADDRGVIVLSEDDLRHLRRCVELATEALADGDEPFGSILVSKTGRCSRRTATGWLPVTKPVIPSSNWPDGRRLT
jgi:hypothetical protein